MARIAPGSFAVRTQPFSAPLIPVLIATPGKNCGGASLVGPPAEVRHWIQYVKSGHSLRCLPFRACRLNDADITRPPRGGGQSKYELPDALPPFCHGYVPNTSCKAG